MHISPYAAIVASREASQGYAATFAAVAFGQLLPGLTQKNIE
jgi:hypothetical protein